MADLQTWEIVTKQVFAITDRLKVPGGWVYRTMTVPLIEGEPVSVAAVFVPKALD